MSGGLGLLRGEAWYEIGKKRVGNRYETHLVAKTPFDGTQGKPRGLPAGMSSLLCFALLCYALLCFALPVPLVYTLKTTSLVRKPTFFRTAGKPDRAPNCITKKWV